MSDKSVDTLSLKPHFIVLNSPVTPCPYISIRLPPNSIVVYFLESLSWGGWMGILVECCKLKQE